MTVLITAVSLESRRVTIYFVHACSGRFSCIQHFATLWSVAHQAPLSMGFPRQGHWSGVPCPPPGDLSDPRTEPRSPEAPALQADSVLLREP